MRPAWRGIVGWLCILVALAVGLTAPWPQNAYTLAAVVLAAVGGLLVAAQIIRTEARRPR